MQTTTKLKSQPRTGKLFDESTRWVLLGTRNKTWFQVIGCYDIKKLPSLYRKDGSLRKSYGLLEWNRKWRDGYIPSRILMRDCKKKLFLPNASPTGADSLDRIFSQTFIDEQMDLPVGDIGLEIFVAVVLLSMFLGLPALCLLFG
jgi:hypothetical protein